jgi:glycosyltransferase involved in cell wall biosynthesis
LNGSSEKLRILQVVDRFSAGGIPRIVELVHQAGIHFGWQVKTFAWYGDVPESWGTSVNPKDSSFFQRIKAFREVVKQYKPHIIHDHYGGLLAAVFLVGESSTKNLFHVHNELLVHPESPDKPRTFRTELFRRFLLPRYHAFVSVSQHSKKQLVAVCPSAEAPTSVIANAVGEVEGAKISKKEAREKLGLPEGVPVFLGLGRLVFEKGFDLHIEVLEKLLQTHPDTLLLLVGDGDDLFIQQLQEMAASLGIEKHVRFTGRLDKVGIAYRAADVFLFASRQEPFGLTLLESMACECPVVAVLPEQGGGPEEFLNGNFNCQLSNRNPGDAAASIVNVLSSSALREKLIKNGALTAFEHRPEVFQEQIGSLYRSLLTE